MSKNLPKILRSIQLLRLVHVYCQRWIDQSLFHHLLLKHGKMPTNINIKTLNNALTCHPIFFENLDDPNPLGLF